MDILVAKVLGLLLLFGLMLAGVLVPVRLLLVDYDKANRYRRALALCNSFGGGVFLATCFNALLPAVRVKVSEVFGQLQISSDFPLAETVMVLGLLLSVFVEQAVLTFRTEPPPLIDLETFNSGGGGGGGGGSEAGSDSEYDTPFISPSPPPSSSSSSARGRGHAHLAPGRLAGAGPLRLAGLALALSAHSGLEGVALGLQEDGAQLGGLLLGVAVHETLAAVALGVSVAKAGLGPGAAARLGVAVALTVPLGALLGAGVQAARTLAGGVASVALQGLAAGTFLFVTFFEILGPELEDGRDRLLKVLALLLGYAALATLVCVRW